MFIPKDGTDVTTMDEFAKDIENNKKTETETQQSKLQPLGKTHINSLSHRVQLVEVHLKQNY